MTITWHGQSCFRLQGTDVSILIDPFSSEIGLVAPRSKNDIVLISHNHLDHNNYNGEGFKISGPGEYEVKEVSVLGIEGYHGEDEKNKELITIYKIKMEGITLCHLSDFGQKTFLKNQLDLIGDVDILFVPVGGEYLLDGKKLKTLNGEEASEIVNEIEPRIVIPMHYKVPGLKIKEDGVENFLKAEGEKNLEPVEKLVIKKKDLDEGKTRIVILKTP